MLFDFPRSFYKLPTLFGWHGDHHWVGNVSLGDSAQTFTPNLGKLKELEVEGMGKKDVPLP